MKNILYANEILEISSPYLNEGRKDDVWKIEQIKVDGTQSISKVSMEKYYISDKDVGFHLSSFSALEFLSQIFIIHHHVLSNQSQKTQEAWMMETSIKCKKAIRNPENITVLAELLYKKKIGSKFLGSIKAQIQDENGLFEAQIKAIIA